MNFAFIKLVSHLKLHLYKHQELYRVEGEGSRFDPPKFIGFRYLQAHLFLNIFSLFLITYCKCIILLYSHFPSQVPAIRRYFFYFRERFTYHGIIFSRVALRHQPPSVLNHWSAGANDTRRLYDSSPTQTASSGETHRLNQLL